MIINHRRRSPAPILTGVHSLTEQSSSARRPNHVALSEHVTAHDTAHVAARVAARVTPSHVAASRTLSQNHASRSTVSGHVESFQDDA
jgi:hypothetical protein